MSKATKEVEPRATRGLVLICEKCGKRATSAKSEDCSKDLKDSLKSDLNRERPGKTIRAVLTGCMGVCPEDRILVTLTSTDGGRPQKCLAIEPEHAHKAVLDEVLDYFGA